MRILFYCFTLAVFAACSSDKPSEAAPSRPAETPATSVQSSAKKNIVFFGNSLTAAYNLDPDQGFVSIIQRKIDSLGWDYTCVNAGLSGETTSGGTGRIDWILQQPIDVFVLELGANDALRGIEVAASKKNLQTILDKVKAKYPNCKLVLAGMLAPPNMGNAYTSAFRQIYPDLAAQYNATLIPFLLEGVAAQARYNLEDGIHPNVAGQKIVAETVWASLKTVLR